MIRANEISCLPAQLQTIERGAVTVSVWSVELLIDESAWIELRQTAARQGRSVAQHIADAIQRHGE